MISPHTPPATKVVCIDARPVPVFKTSRPIGDLDGLSEGRSYNVLDIVEAPSTISGFAVVLVEIVRPQRNLGVGGFALERFRYAELPRSITALLTSQSLVHEREREVVE